ncbi:hypothetical protein J4439_03850 [Candidatus Woesearchaeota archaeon]|nr:hypothetical protein [Candidatus Woesearchaeota archaeon]
MADDALERVMLRKKMDSIAQKAKPSRLEQLQYLRYALERGSSAEELSREFGPKWGGEAVDEMLSSLKRESRPKPDKYHVSIREPLEDPFTR